MELVKLAKSVDEQLPPSFVWIAIGKLIPEDIAQLVNLLIKLFDCYFIFVFPLERNQYFADYQVHYDVLANCECVIS